MIIIKKKKNKSIDKLLESWQRSFDFKVNKIILHVIKSDILKKLINPS
jgi:hypothetical protein